MHHASIRTTDIHRAMAFYTLLGFAVEEQFTAGITLACWMVGYGGRIELLQVPEPKPTPDCFFDEHYTGYYHLTFDLTKTVDTLPKWLESLQTRFAEARAHSPQDDFAALRVLLPPQQQMIGSRVYEVTFIADADGLPLEFLRMMNDE